MTIFFNNNRIHREYVPYEKDVKITEIKAPTDDAIRLLNEMQEKARKNIINSVSINENTIKAVTIAYYYDHPWSFNIIIDFKFTLNGIEYKFSETIDHNAYRNGKLRTMSRQLAREIYELLIKRFSEAIAKELISQQPFILDGPNSLLNNFKY